MKYHTDRKDRELLLSRAAEAVEIDQGGHYKSSVIDAALQHLVESRRNMDRIRERDDLPPEAIQWANTSVLKYRYRTSVDTDA